MAKFKYRDKDGNFKELQHLLVSGENIKTINNQSILGSGNINIQGGGASSFADLTGQPTDNANLATALNAKYDSTNPSGYQTASQVSTAITTATSSFITKDVNNLTNYTKTSDLATVATSGSYNDLSNLPTIPTVPTNVGDFTNDVGYQTSTQVSNTVSTHNTSNTAHSDIRTALTNGLAEKENTSNKVTTITSSSTDTQYPSAKCIYDLLGNVEELINTL